MIRLGRAFGYTAYLGLFVTAVIVAGVTVALADGTSWHRLKIGSGGFVTGIDISADGSAFVARTDTYGAYVWDEARSEWRQLVTSDSMPENNVGVDQGAGVFEIRVAARLPNRLYMAFRGSVYRSDDRGLHWEETNFTKVPMDPNDKFRMLGQKMAVDPLDPDTVYMGSAQNGLYRTNDAGKTWDRIVAIPSGSPAAENDSAGITGIAFDEILGTTGGKTQTIFVASYGHGVFKSADAGSTWSSIGGPNSVQFAAVSKDGTYYVIGDGHTIWSYRESTWLELYDDKSANGLETVAINPANPNEIVVQTEGGSLNISYDKGKTWSGSNWKNQFQSLDIPWLADSGSYMTIGGTIFDPIVQNKLWVSDGVGVWSTELPTSNFQWDTPVIWHDQSRGIEQLVANQIVSPPGGKPVVASWDRPAFYIDDPETYPSHYGPDNKNAIVMGWALDYASTDPTFVVGLFDWQAEKSAYSTDGGQNWRSFTSYPPTVAKGKIGGSIAASTAQNIVWVPSNNSQPYYTVDGGLSWKQILINGVPTSGETGWSGAYYLNRHIVAADRIKAGTFYLYNYIKGLFRSLDGGLTWSLIKSGQIAPFSGFNASIQTVPEHAGNLFFSSGAQGSPGPGHPADNPFMRSIDGGVTWSKVSNVLEVRAFGFGKGLTDYPSIFVDGWVMHKYGLWRSDDNANSWVKIGDFPLGSLDGISAVAGDSNMHGTVYVGFKGSGYAYGTSK